MDKEICIYLEVSYVIKKDNNFTVDDEMYPIFELESVGPKYQPNFEFNLNLLQLFNDY